MAAIERADALLQVEGWTEMNGVVYHGNNESRRLIEEHEFYYAAGSDDDSDGGPSQTDPGGRSVDTHPRVEKSAAVLRFAGMWNSVGRVSGMCWRTKLGVMCSIFVLIRPLSASPTLLCAPLSCASMVLRYKFNVLITTWEVVMGDERDGNTLGSIPWDCVIVDEVRPADCCSQDSVTLSLFATAGDSEWSTDIGHFGRHDCYL
jgi:hypothetical protein